MGRETQPPYSRLTPRLEAELTRINFYRFCQLLEKRHPQRRRWGRPANRAMTRCGWCPIRAWAFRPAS